MGVDAYLKIEGLPGEGADEEHKDWIEVRQLLHRIYAATATDGRVKHDSLKIKKYIDRASPLLMERCSAGTHMPTATIEIIRPSGDRRVRFFEIKLSEVIIADVELAFLDDGDRPSEWVSFDYAKIKWRYVPHIREGHADPVIGSWDLTKNSKWGE